MHNCCRGATYRRWAGGGEIVPSFSLCCGCGGTALRRSADVAAAMSLLLTLHRRIQLNVDVLPTQTSCRVIGSVRSIQRKKWLQTKSPPSC